VSGQRLKLGSEVVEPGTYAFDLPFSQVLAPGALEVLPPVLEYVPSEIDGEDIELGYWLPKVDEGTKVPILVHASPYHRPAGSVINGNQSIKRFLIHNFVPHGYAVAAVAVRGTAGSGGCMVMGDSTEAADLSQAITYLATQPWSNGNVAMIGLSYDGSTPWMVAGTGNPHLKTIVPISGVTDWYKLMFRNGSAELRSQLIMNYAYWEYSWNVVTPLGAGSETEREPDKRVDGILCPEAYQGLAAASYATVEGGRDSMGFWDDRNHRPRVEANYKGSILNVHGLDDWNVDPSSSLPWVNELNATQGLVVHQMLGQWTHTRPDTKSNDPSAIRAHHRMDFAEKLLDWFDYFLKEQTTIDLGPSVTVQDQTRRWRVEQNWPPVDADWATYHLREGNQLAPEPGGTEQSAILLPNPVGENPIYANLRQAPGYPRHVCAPRIQVKFGCVAMVFVTLLVGYLPRKV
jgi:predicted acyl esterase